MTTTEHEHARTEAPAGASAMCEADLLRFIWIADPRMSPDGTRIAFTRVSVDVEADEYRTHLWLAEVATGRVRALTFGGRDAQPRWSPDGTRIAFVRSPEAGKPAQLHVLSLDGGDAAPVCTLEKGASEPVWSPDGTAIAFLSGTNPAIDVPDAKKPKHEPGRVVLDPVFRENGEGFIDHEHASQVWVAAAPNGITAPPRQLTSGRYPAALLQWSLDGRWLLFVSDRRAEPWFGPEASALYAVSPARETAAATEDLTTVIDFGGPVMSYVQHPNGGIAFVGFENPEVMRSYNQPTLMWSEGPWPRRTVRDLTAACDDEVGGAIMSDQHAPRGGGLLPLAISADGRAFLVTVARHGESVIARVPLEGGTPAPLTPAGFDLSAGTASADGRRWALTLGDPARPGDLYAFDAETRALTKVWAPNDAWLADVRLGDVEEFWYPSFDGQKIQAWLVKPPDFDPARRYPLVLQIHGGPHGAYARGFFHEFHMLANAGFLVLFTNPRGSTTYGQSFADVIQYKFPGDDAKDLLAGVDSVVARGCVDPKRFGVTGGSGGGLLTNWLITQTDRFAGAVTQRCVADWASMVYSCDFALFEPFWFKKLPHEDPQDYLERSPATFAAKITTPLMIIHSEEDWRTPIAQGEQMFRALKAQKKTAVMVRFPGESHELSRSGAPSRRVQNQQHIRAWFDRWLLGKPAPQYGV